MPFNNTTRVIEILDTNGASADALHANLLAVLRECVGTTKAAIISEPDLARIFSHSFKGTDRKRVVAWVEAYSPVRVKFHDNGRFDKIAWSRTYVKARKDAGLPVFDVDGAEADPWFDFEPAGATTKAKAGDVDKALKAFAKQIARVAYETDVRSALDRANEAVANDLMKAVLDVMDSDAFVEWAAKRDAAIEAEARAMAQAEAERKVERSAQSARIAELRGQFPKAA